MSISFRVSFLALILAFVAFACSPAEQAAPVAAVPQATDPTAVLTVVPKQNDLIFIEFFAGT